MDTKELRARAEAATPGKWCQFHPGYVEGAKGTPVTQWDTSHDVSAVVDGKKTKRIATFTHADDAAYLDAANPTVILSLLDELEAMRKALELAAGRMTWAASAVPGASSNAGRILMRQFADEARATLSTSAKQVNHE